MSKRRASTSATIIFTDGASSGNPGPGGWGAILATADGRVIELGGGEPETTNNRMELTAAVEALVAVEETEPGDEIRLHVDSTYVIKGITHWIEAWRRNGWTTRNGDAVANRDLWERLDGVVARLSRRTTLSWTHVRGHRGVPGNERVDAIAVAHTRGETPELYAGERSSYDIDLDAFPANETAPDGTVPSRSRRRGKPYSYLSLVGDELRRHASWAECEARVSGRSGARYKKAMTREEEREIVRSWGRDPGELGR